MAFYYQCSSSYSVFLMRKGREEGKRGRQTRNRGETEQK